MNGNEFKEFIKSLIRKEYLIIANHFLSQNFVEAPKEPTAAEIVGMSREELLKAIDIFDRKVQFRDVITA